ncbi:TonB-dependent receptor domain-containing protein [Pedobacter glucosidilyticus]|uniref:TonB-dependent receptor domain-containing protein n=1 Tax=Pedobacter glucosidilyticus TaxID=1122941 RepID=UPI0003FE931F|nr:TonB-dependent receptor [Pedobacter glucosidilyticus]
MRCYFYSSVILFVFIAFSAQLFAQSAVSVQIKGKVTDAKTSDILDFATVKLLKADNTPFKATQSNLEGYFIFNDINETGNFKLNISFVGYNTLNRNITITTQKVIDLGVLKLSKNADAVLKEVVVTGKKDVIQLGIDRKVFNADQSLATQGGTATDLLATVPSVQVDLDGNVSLRGTNNVRILIDGKPSTFGGGDVNAILQSLPANAIDKVELITNPSSKYDPEGQSGIINIVLKRNQRLGVNGNVNTSAGRLNNYNFNTGLNFRNEKWNFSGNYSLRSGDRIGLGSNNTTFLGTSNTSAFTTANQNTLRSDLTNTLKLGMERYFTPNTSLAISGNLNVDNEDARETLSQFFFDNSGALQDRGPGENLNTEDGYGYDLNLDFFHKFKNPGEELSTNFSFGNRDEDEFENIVQQFFNNQGEVSNRLGVNRINQVAELNKNINIQVDYIKPFSKTSKLEAGYRTTLRYNDEDQVSDTLVANFKSYNRDYDLTSLFEMEEFVHAAYTNYQKQFTDNFGAQIGLRAEQAYLNTNFTRTDINGMPRSAPGGLDYFRLYPSIFLTQKFKGDNQLQLSYSRRVNRPRGWQINPFPDVADRYNIRIGNPNLRPEDIHSFEFGYAKFWKAVTLTSSVYYRQVNDVVQSIRQQNPDQNGGTISRWFNIARNQSFGLELISRADIAKGFNVTGNLNFFQTYFTGDASLGINDNDGFNWNGNLTSQMTISKNLSAQANLFYMAPRVMSQGRMKEMIAMDAGIRYDVLNKKGSIGLNMQDVFNSRRFGMLTDNGQFIQEFERRRQGQMYNLSFSYRFGKMENNNQRRNNKRPENTGGGMGEEGF